MPTETEGAFVQAEVEKRYQQYLADHHGEVDVPRLCEVMWNAGGRQAIFAMTSFGDILPLISRIESRIVGLRSLLDSVYADDR